jgi:predicted ferric reductase
MLRTLLFIVPFAVVGVFVGTKAPAELASAALPEAGSHGAWYASRAAGVAAYLFLWLGLAGGLLMSSAWFDGIVGRAKLLAIHQSASIAGVILGLGHALVLIPDGWTQFGLMDVLVPFGSYYKRTDVAFGTLSLYLGAIVSFSFWFRSLIGTRNWKLLHYGSFVAYVGALWHGMQVGTDSSEPWLLGLYLATSLSIVFALVVRLTYARAARKRPEPANGVALA